MIGIVVMEIVRFGAGRRWVSALGSLALLVAHATSFAQSTSDDLARRHFESGAAYLEESDYDNALQAFQKAYDLSKRPEILLNIATVHERNAELQPAIDALNQYLSVATPGDEHVDPVKLRIQNLQKRLDDEKATAPAAAGASAAGAPTGGASLTAAPPSTAVSATPPAAPATPAHASRLPAFIAFGVGGVAAGAAVITGIIADSDYNSAKSSCSPACSNSQLSSGRTLALTSTILTGVAVVGVGVGVTLLLTSGPDPAQTSLAPRLHLAGAPGAAHADATWRF